MSTAFRRHYLQVLLSVLLICSGASRALGQKGYVLTLGSEGSATVFIAEDAHVAYITDGGRKSGGLGQALIDGKSLADFLIKHSIDRVVVICSHPDDDHLAGLVAFLTSDEILRIGLTKVDFVESGFRKAEGSERPLFDIYESIWSDKPKRPPKADPHSALNNDALGSIKTGSSKLEAFNLKYLPKKNAGAHGHTIVTTIVLKDGDRQVRLVDSDDADSDVIAAWAKWAMEDPVNRRPDIFILPHHGTDPSYTNINPLFNEAIRPKKVIFVVNENNRFLHPSWATVRLCLGEFGESNVHFTAGTNNIFVSENGLQVLDETKSPLGAFLEAIGPRLAVINQRIAQLEDAGELTPRQKSRLKAYKKWADGCAAVCREWKAQPGKWPVAKDSDRDDEPPLSPVGGGSPTQPRPRPPFDGGIAATSPRGGPPPRRPPSGPLYPNVGRVNDLFLRTAREVRRVPTPGRVSAPRIKAILRARPVFGGVVVGNEFDDGGFKVKDASFELVTNEDGVQVPRIVLQVIRVNGEITHAVYVGQTITELWAACRFVDPKGTKVEGSIEEDECGLVGIQRNLGDQHAWTFGVHPAIANTLVAADSMRLDMTLKCPKVPDGLPKLPPAWRFNNYQWHDDDLAFQVGAGEVRVISKNLKAGPVMRFRLWGPLLPEWTANSKTLEGAVADEVFKRLRASAGKVERLEKSGPYLVAAMPYAIRQKTEAGEGQSIFQALFGDSAEVKYAKENGILDSPSYIVDRMLHAVQLQLGEEKQNRGIGVAIDRDSVAKELVAAKTVLRNGENIADTLAFKLLLKQLQVEHELSRKMPAPRTVALVGNVVTMNLTPDRQEKWLGEVLGRMSQYAKEQNLASSQEFVALSLELAANRSTYRELAEYLRKGEDNVAYDSYPYVVRLQAQNDALDRIDRFARVVAVLRWIPTNDNILGPWRINVPPVFFFDNVFTRPQLAE
jgi:beta-lactamase superfamily II metal-dependent hydrolase